MASRKWHRRQAMALAASLLTLSACAADLPMSGGQTVEDALGYTPQRWRALIEARDQAVEHCMSVAGFRFRVSTDWAFLSTSPRGPFDLTTPTAVVEYERRYGYGLVQRVAALRQAERDFAAESNDEYFATLSAADQNRFRETLYGPNGDTGCASQGLEVTAGIPLPEGGQLGEDYGAALGELYESGDYQDWEADVVDCLEEHDISVANGELATAARPHLVELLELTGSDYETDGEGRLKYSLSVEGLGADHAARLRRLAVDERRAAGIEADCREQHADRLDGLMAEASRDVLRDYADEISALRGALLAAGRHFRQPARTDEG